MNEFNPTNPITPENKKIMEFIQERDQRIKAGMRNVEEHYERLGEWANAEAYHERFSRLFGATALVYVHFVDAIGVNKPVNAHVISNDFYQILPDIEYDLDIEDESDDNTVLFEFGPGDIVGVKPYHSNFGDSVPLAYKLIIAGDLHNSPKCLQFQILEENPDPYELLQDLKKEDILALLDKVNNADFVYPAIKEWITRNQEII
jgi:hypothetical protein